LSPTFGDGFDSGQHPSRAMVKLLCVFERARRGSLLGL
jgi:hypothetical protein